MIFSVTSSHRTYQSLSILKYFNICFGQKISCLHIGIAILKYLVLHIMEINQLIFDYVHLYILIVPFHDKTL